MHLEGQALIEVQAHANPQDHPIELVMPDNDIPLDPLPLVFEAEQLVNMIQVPENPLAKSLLGIVGVLHPED